MREPLGVLVDGGVGEEAVRGALAASGRAAGVGGGGEFGIGGRGVGFGEVLAEVGTVAVGGVAIREGAGDGGGVGNGGEGEEAGGDCGVGGGGGEGD